MKQYYGDIKEIKSSTDLEEVNKLIKGGWILIETISNHERMQFILGLISQNHQLVFQG